MTTQPTPFSVDAMLADYRTLKAAAVERRGMFPCLLALGTTEPHTHAWLPTPFEHPAQHAVGLVRMTTGATWACYLADAVVSWADDLTATRPGAATAALEAGDPDTYECLVATWVSLAGPPVVLVQPYIVHTDRTVQWLPVHDTRYNEHALAGGAVPMALQAALQHSKAGTN